MVQFQDGPRLSNASTVDQAHSLVNLKREGGVGRFGFAPTLGRRRTRSCASNRTAPNPRKGRIRENMSRMHACLVRSRSGETIEISSRGFQFRCVDRRRRAWLHSFPPAPPLKRDGARTDWYVPEPPRPSGAVENAVVVLLPSAAEPKLTDVVEETSRSCVRTPGERPLLPTVRNNPSNGSSASGNASRWCYSPHLSTYLRERQRGTRPHDAPASQQDFREEIVRLKGSFWSKVWKRRADIMNDYSHFVSGCSVCDCELSVPNRSPSRDLNDYVGVLCSRTLLAEYGAWTSILYSLMKGFAAPRRGSDQGEKRRARARCSRKVSVPDPP